MTEPLDLDLDEIESCVTACRGNPMQPHYDEDIDALRFRHAPALIAYARRLRAQVEELREENALLRADPCAVIGHVFLSREEPAPETECNRCRRVTWADVTTLARTDGAAGEEG